MEQSNEKRQEANTPLATTLESIRSAGYTVNPEQLAALRQLEPGNTYSDENKQWSVTADEDGYHVNTGELE